MHVLIYFLADQNSGTLILANNKANKSALILSAICSRLLAFELMAISKAKKRQPYKNTFLHLLHKLECSEAL